MNAQKFNKLIKLIKIDATAFKEIYIWYYERIVFYLISYGKEFAEDVAQEFFLKLLLHDSENMDYINMPTVWVFKCCQNLAKRKKLNENKYICVENDELQIEQEEYDDIYGIKDKLSELDEKSRKIIMMKFWYGYTSKEIADELEIKPNSVGQLIHRTIKKLKKIL